MLKNLTNHECVVCGKRDTDMTDKSGRLSFCSEKCADNTRSITNACNNALQRYRDIQGDIKRAENDIREMTTLQQSWGELFQALEAYLEEGVAS